MNLNLSKVCTLFIFLHYNFFSICFEANETQSRILRDIKYHETLIFQAFENQSNRLISKCYIVASHDPHLPAPTIIAYHHPLPHTTNHQLSLSLHFNAFKVHHNIEKYSMHFFKYIH